MKSPIQMINESIDKALLERALPPKSGTPYMMRNDGEVFEVSYSERGPVDHPYIVDRARRQERDFIPDSLTEMRKCFKWFFDHTGSRALKKYIQNYYLALIESNFNGVATNQPLRQTTESEFDLTHTQSIPTIEMSLEGAQLALPIIEESANQEFLRFRFQAESQGLNMYCRVSSVDFNWYDNLCIFLFGCYRQLSTITITTDALAGMENKIKRYKGQPFIQMPINEFLTLSGHPMVEQLNQCQNILREDLGQHFKFCGLRKGNLLADLGEFSNSRVVKDLIPLLHSSAATCLMESAHATPSTTEEV